MNRILLIFLFLGFGINSVFSRDSIQAKKVKILPVPSIGYSPETKTYFGAVSLFSFNFYNDSTTRNSNSKIEITYTLKKQIIFENEWNYFFSEEKWFTKGKIHYSKYPDYYYGIGGNTPTDNELLFNSNRFIFEGNILKQTGNKLFAGINLKFIDYSKVSASEDNILYPELTGSSVFGIGLTVLKDSRDNLITPTGGWYVLSNIGYNFSEKNYAEAALDKYFSVKSINTLSLIKHYPQMF